MIIENQQDVTKAVLAELARAPNARFREIMSAFVRHLHDFARGDSRHLALQFFLPHLFLSRRAESTRRPDFCTDRESLAHDAADY